MHLILQPAPAENDIQQKLNWQLKNKIAVLENVLAQHSNELEGNFVVATEQTVRIVRMNKLH